MAMVFFAFQIYCDFSGYSDIAIGSAQVMGFRLMTNFNRPFFAKTTGELWQRWHISLSTWFFDYVYNPLAIAARGWGSWAVVFALLVTFFLIGLWHGADWKYIIFGLLQWVVLSGEFLIRKPRKVMASKLPRAINNTLGIIFTFGFFSLILTFFDAHSAQDAIYAISQLPYGWNDLISGEPLEYACGILITQFWLYLGLMAALIAVENVQGNGSIRQMISTKPIWVRWMAYYLVVVPIVCSWKASVNIPYIYFKF
jgi:D-alanyl-lipoteichoic acid acyltransferase DltB (MBOAT superfamily)